MEDIEKTPEEIVETITKYEFNGNVYDTFEEAEQAVIDYYKVDKYCYDDNYFDTTYDIEAYIKEHASESEYMPNLSDYLEPAKKFDDYYTTDLNEKLWCVGSNYYKIDDYDNVAQALINNYSDPKPLITYGCGSKVEVDESGVIYYVNDSDGTVYSESTFIENVKNGNIRRDNLTSCDGYYYNSTYFDNADDLYTYIQRTCSVQYNGSVYEINCSDSNFSDFYFGESFETEEEANSWIDGNTPSIEEYHVDFIARIWNYDTKSYDYYYYKSDDSELDSVILQVYDDWAAQSYIPSITIYDDYGQAYYNDWEVKGALANGSDVFDSYKTETDGWEDCYYYSYSSIYYDTEESFINDHKDEWLSDYAESKVNDYCNTTYSVILNDNNELIWYEGSQEAGYNDFISNKISEIEVEA